jgi:hypothetical protein
LRLDLNLRLSESLPSNLRVTAIGVITRKKTTPRIRGLTTRLRRSPNLNQARLREPRIEGRAKVITRRIIELTSINHPADWPFKSIHVPATTNTMKNTIPKERSEDTLILSSLFKVSCMFLLPGIKNKGFFSN